MSETNKVIEILNKAKTIIEKWVPMFEQYNTPAGIDDAIALLKEHGWNALTEDADGVIHGLPGDDGQYLMTDGKDIWIDEYMDGVADGIILDSGRDIREIKAWMYMPELPKTDRR